MIEETNKQAFIKEFTTTCNTLPGVDSIEFYDSFITYHWRHGASDIDTYTILRYPEKGRLQ